MADLLGVKNPKRKQLKRCVERVLKTEYGTEVATAVEDEATALIEETDRFLADLAPATSPIADVDTPSPNDLGRVVALFSFPDHCIPCEEKLTCGDCNTSGCTSEHQSGPYFELLAFMTSAKLTLDISMYILSCQFVILFVFALLWMRENIVWCSYCSDSND